MFNNFLTKLWLKAFNKGKYQEIKNKIRTTDNIKFYKTHIYNKILEIQKNIENKKKLSFLHSGRSGDLIYSLATIKEISKTHECTLYVQINKLTFDQYELTRKVFIDEKMGNLILPLLQNQTFLKSVKIYNDEKIDINLDLFREIPINLSFYTSRWFSHLAGININIENSFLSAKPHETIKNKIIVGRSPRYRNAYLNYKFLQNRKNLLCIGLKEEFYDLKKDIPNLEYHDCKDFLEMAQILKASNFFIGNMCLQYIMSEGLKIPRLLEASTDFPVAFPAGPMAFDAYHQIHFEKYFELLDKS